LFLALTEDNAEGDMRVPVAPNDYNSRGGLTQEPQTLQDINKNIPVTHGYIRFLNWWQKVTVRINAHFRNYGTAQTPKQKYNLMKAEFKLRKKAWSGPLHLKLDQPDSAGAGGTTDTAENAWMFFLEKNREHVVALVEGSQSEKDTFRNLHKNFSVILRVICSKERLIDTDSLDNLCMETNLLISEKLHWANIPQCSQDSFACCRENTNE
jgi:hypothetical protein